MPSRILREGILTSERIDMLTPAGEVFYRRLMSVVDDYGRFDGRPSVLRVKCFPLRVDTVLEPHIIEWLDEAIDAGLVLLYTAGGKPYVEMQDFDQQQRTKSKCPPATDGEMLDSAASLAKQMLSNGSANAERMPSKRLSHAKQPLSTVHLGVFGVVSEVEGGSSSEPLPGSEPLSDFGISLNDNTEFRVPKASLDLWKRTYTAVNVEQELREMATWALANKQRRKTARGVESFIVRWLAKAQDTPARSAGQRRNDNPSTQDLMEGAL